MMVLISEREHLKTGLAHTSHSASELYFLATCEVNTEYLLNQKIYNYIVRIAINSFFLDNT